MANNDRGNAVSLFLVLVLSFVLCSAQSCQNVLTGGGGGQSWMELLSAGRAAVKSGDYVVGEEMYVKAVSECKRKYGPESGQTSTCMAELAQMYRAQQEYRKAAKTYKELIALKEKIDPKGLELGQLKEQYQEIRNKLKSYGMTEDGEPIKPAEKPAKPAGKPPGKTGK